MKRILLLALALLTALSLAACGGNGGGQTGDDESFDGMIKVGFILIGSKTDGGFSQAHANGIDELEAYFGGLVKTMAVENVDDQNRQDIRSAAENMIDAGCTVIIGCSYGYMETMAELAEEYPDIYFLHFSGSMMNDTNFDNYFGAMEEPRYLAGIVAGMMTETNKVGYVAAYPYTEVQIGINAFALGVQSVNPGAVVNVVYINTWYDPEKEKSAAQALLAQGCDVLEQHCDTAGPIIAAQEAGAYAIGYNLDKPDSAPKAYLTAPVWDHGAYYIDVIKKILDGTFSPESYYGNMASGYVGLAPLSDLVPGDVKAKVEEVKARIMSGEFAPFSGEILYADGSVLCEDGQTLNRDQIWEINRVVKGVNATE
ncbi:MAG: BMP family ABC transporter substrate-binding protein [Clostridiales bacterium]|nr:BMP family ABC transporter substrate-binding protein [Clostridiales bacterium]